MNEQEETTMKVVERQPDEPTKVESEPVEQVKLFVGEERINAMHELSILQSLIATRYWAPNWDEGNKGKQERKITKSIELNFFQSEEIIQWRNKVIELTTRLGWNSPKK